MDDYTPALRAAVIALHEQAHDLSPARTCQVEPCVGLNRIGALDGPPDTFPPRGRSARSVADVMVTS